MNNKIKNIAILSSALTTIGFLMDGDVKEPSMLMRFVEFFGMFSILFILIYSVYAIKRFAFKKK
ncbi:hypothetical protein [Psychroflexus halocasei]|uniref:Uncharacterized protein n=1 Tax=Psychroflexus halocasei TaxID=908615 RepID=A0A1H3ZX59_9FLAO|nr:hypothetical protein [Psychroflexus halocasei]SEA28260.1 hypothetical protein SAMN05421540_104241 [Psychroflexus halocasei]